MADARRLDPDPDSSLDRESQVEALLVDGLDRYFGGRYEDAIHVWTRVLFLDRSHARARAYIDRARTALAERQRRSDELLQASQHLLERGEAGAARDLLSEAVAASGDDEQAAALRLKLERHERAQAVLHPRRPSAARAPEVVPGWSWMRRSPAVVVVVAGLVATLLLVVALPSRQLRNWMGFGAVTDSLTAASTPEPVPVLSSSEAALVRARNLYARGRLAQALQVLDRVADDSPVRQKADDLRVEIQRLLLAGHSQPLPSASSSGNGR